jgi:hypothetical protein
MRVGVSSRSVASVLVILFLVITLAYWLCQALGKRSDRRYTTWNLQHSSYELPHRPLDTSGRSPPQSLGQGSDHHTHQRHISLSGEPLVDCVTTKIRTMKTDLLRVG